MIINDEAAAKRLNSPLNLINRLAAAKHSNRNSAMSLFIPPSSSEKSKNKEVKIFNPFESKTEVPLAILPIPSIETSTTLDTILENNESQIKLGLAHDKALELLHRSVDMLATKLDDVKAEKLPAVVTAARSVIEGIRKERNEATKNSKDREVHYHFYTPSQREIKDYEVIDVGVAE